MADNVTAGTQSGSGPVFATDQRASDSAHFPKNKLAWGADDTFNDVDLSSGFPVQPGTGTTWAATQSGTWNITNVSGTISLPTGAATAAKQPALGTAGSAATDVITVQGIASGTALAVSNSALTSIIADYNADAAIHVAQQGNVTVQGTGTFAVQATVSPSTSGGLTPYTLVSAASNNATSVKASAGQLYNVTAFNNSTNVAYLKFYDKATSPTPASDTVKQSYMIPASSGFTVNIDKGLAFGTGIAFAIVGGVGNTDNTSVAASAYVVNLGYK
jgi:hypothetical protein